MVAIEKVLYSLLFSVAELRNAIDSAGTDRNYNKKSPTSPTLRGGRS